MADANGTNVKKRHKGGAYEKGEFSFYSLSILTEEGAFSLGKPPGLLHERKINSLPSTPINSYKKMQLFVNVEL